MSLHLLPVYATCIRYIQLLTINCCCPGVVSSVKESYGFLQILSANCSTGVGDAQLFFHFNELYESINTPVVVGDEIEFTVSICMCVCL